MRVFFLFLAGIFMLKAEDFCSLTIEVVDAHDQKLSGVLVGMHEPNGHQEAIYSTDGIARFCGLGTSPVTITIGADKSQCDMTISRIPLTWAVPRYFKVHYDPELCTSIHERGGVSVPPGTVPVFSCSALLRFFDEDGHQLPLVKIRDVSSDQYGRVMLQFRSNENLHPLAEKDGFLPTTLDLKCTSSGEFEERIISLRRAQPDHPR